MSEKTELSDSDVKSYVAGGGLKCPFCGNDQLQGDSFDVEAGECRQEMSCPRCHAEWWDVYQLKGLEVTQTPDLEDLPPPTPEEPIPMGSFSDRLAEAMQGRSIRKFALAAGVTEGAIRKYLKGEAEPKMKTLEAISDASGFGLEWLCNGDGPKSVFEEMLGDISGEYNSLYFIYRQYMPKEAYSKAIFKDGDFSLLKRYASEFSKAYNAGETMRVPGILRITEANAESILKNRIWLDLYG